MSMDELMPDGGMGAAVMGGAGAVMNLGTAGELTVGMKLVLRGRGVEVGGIMGLIWGAGGGAMLI